jgi:hypothetical protein
MIGSLGNDLVASSGLCLFLFFFWFVLHSIIELTGVKRKSRYTRGAQLINYTRRNIALVVDLSASPSIFYQLHAEDFWWEFFILSPHTYEHTWASTAPCVAHTPCAFGYTTSAINSYLFIILLQKHHVDGESCHRPWLYWRVHEWMKEEVAAASINLNVFFGYCNLTWVMTCLSLSQKKYQWSSANSVDSTWEVQLVSLRIAWGTWPDFLLDLYSLISGFFDVRLMSCA